MELQIKEFSLPSAIDFNFDEIKTELAKRTEQYKVAVYSDEQIADAKKDKANLNKLDKALNDERLRLQREYMAPFDEFKSKIDELRTIIKEPVNLIGQRVQEYEDRKAEEKEKAILDLYEGKAHPEWLGINQIWNPRWLNASASMKSVEGEIDGSIEQAVSQYHSLELLPEFSVEACECYKKTLSIQQALAEVTRLTEYKKAREEAEKRKAEAEARRAAEEAKAKEVKEEQPEQIVVEEAATTQDLRREFAFRIKCTIEEARALRAYMDEHGIEIVR